MRVAFAPLMRRRLSGWLFLRPSMRPASAYPSRARWPSSAAQRRPSLSNRPTRSTCCSTPAWTSADRGTGLPPRREMPVGSTGSIPISQQLQTPTTIGCSKLIPDGRFVALVFQRRRGTLIYGDLRKTGTEFVSWWPFQAQLIDYFSGNGDVAPKWEGKRSSADRIDPKFLNYRYENHDSDDAPRGAWPTPRRSGPSSRRPSDMMLSPIRLALRRYLGIEPRARTRVARATASTRGRVTAEGSGPVPSNKVRKHR